MISWPILRQMALENAKFMCTRCGSLHNLQSHHKKYPALVLEDTEILCARCHTHLHFGKDPIKWSRIKLKIYCDRGKSLREMVNIFGTSHERIRQKLSYFGLSTKFQIRRLNTVSLIDQKKTKPNKPKEDRLQKYCEQGRSTKEIAHIFNRSPKSIRYFLRKFNLIIHRWKPLPNSNLYCYQCGSKDIENRIITRTRVCKKCGYTGKPKEFEIEEG